MRRALLSALVVLAVVLGVAGPASATVPVPHAGEYGGKTTGGDRVIIHVAVAGHAVEVTGFHWKTHPFKQLAAHIAKDHYAFSADFSGWRVHGGWIVGAKPVHDTVTGTLEDKDQHVQFVAHFLK